MHPEKSHYRITLCIVFLLPELRAAEVDVNAMKSQAQSTSKAYDDLLAEKDKLEVTMYFF